MLNQDTGMTMVQKGGAPLRLVLAIVFLLALSVGFIAVRSAGPIDRYPGGDGPYYTGLAQSIAGGQGFVLKRSPWPNAPHLTRLPWWPALLTPGMWLFRHAGEYAVMRYTGVVIQSLAAVLIAFLTYQLWPTSLAALLAGVAYALYPPVFYLIDTGYPEPAFVLTATGGLLLLMSKRFWVQAAGALLSGMAVLVRSNYIMLPAVAIAAALIVNRGSLKYWRRFILLAGVFLLLPSLWILRNYLVSGFFPLLSANEGETLYGGNNSVVATDLTYWGTWVLPNLIPGETPKTELGARMDEAAVNRYYHDRAVEYFRANRLTYPRLILGKLVRGFIPLPWVPQLSTYFAGICRALLYSAFLWYAAKGIISSEKFKIYLLSMFLTVLATTLIYYGTARFSFPLEAFLIPCVAAGLVRDFQSRPTLIGRLTARSQAASAPGGRHRP
jgi:hypothetical protein